MTNQERAVTMKDSGDNNESQLQEQISPDSYYSEASEKARYRMNIHYDDDGRDEEFMPCDSYTLADAHTGWNDVDLTADNLIDNEFANVMLADDKGANRALRSEWIRVLQSEYYNPDLHEDRSPIDGFRPSMSTASRASRRPASRFSPKMTRDEKEDCIAMDAVGSMFAGGTKGMKPCHATLQRVIKTIFGLDELSATIKAASSENKIKIAESRGKVMDMLILWQQLAFNLVSKYVFVIFSFVLTFYALLAPDMVALFGSKEHDEFFLYLNTIIFFLFVVELLLMIVAHSNSPFEYVLSLPFLLDLVAIIGFLNDTWLLQVDKSSGNYGDAARMARLPRLGRVARATRLIPRLIAIVRRSQTSFALVIMLRRLRRAFMVMDVDASGALSNFDLKCLYVCILTECDEMLRGNSFHLLLADKAAMRGNGYDDHDPRLTFADFSQIILRTQLGQDMLRYHNAEVNNSHGIFTLTTKLSDTASLRICIGILIVCVATEMLNIQNPPISAAQGLVHLHMFAIREHALGSLADVTAVCEQVSKYTQDFDVLFLYLGGRTYIDSSLHAINECIASSLPSMSDLSSAMTAALDSSGLRDSEVLKVCWPEVDSCPSDTTVSAALIDEQDKVKSNMMWSMIAMMTVVFIIVLFIFFFQREIVKFRRRTLHPLRRLVDDMIAISCLELVDINPDEEEEGNWGIANSFSNAVTRRFGDLSDGKCGCFRGQRVEKVNREVFLLQQSFKHMQLAIRSWSRYVPPSVVQKLFSRGVEATVGVSKVPCTILFVDVIDFEEAVKGLQPSEVNEILAMMLATVASVVQKNDGTLLEFIGDEVLAVFNTPTAMTAHVMAAVTSALEIHRDMGKLAPVWTPDGRAVPLKCRCGVHTAKVLAGNIGSHRRMKYGLLGDGVNLSARLKSINSRYGTQTIASDQVFKDEFAVHRAVFRPLDLVIVKGKTEPTTLYEVLGFHKAGEGEDPGRTKKLVEAASNHSEAYRLYHNRDFVKAKVKFEEVAASLKAIKHCTFDINSQDTPSAEMRRRCKRHIRNPPGASWDGVERLVAKSFVIDAGEDSDSLKEEEVNKSCADIPRERSEQSIISRTSI